MKKIKTLTLLLLVFTSLTAQSEFKNGLYITTAPIYPIYGWNSGVDGGGSYDGKTSYAVGVEYGRNIIPQLELLGGVSYIANKIGWKAPYMGEPQIEAGTYDINFISIPLQARYTFGKWFFVNSGFVLNFKTSSDYVGDSKFGLILGLGGRIPLDDRFSVIINPYFQTNLLNNSSNRHFYNLGAKVGLGCKF